MTRNVNGDGQEVGEKCESVRVGKGWWERAL